MVTNVIATTPNKPSAATMEITAIVVFISKSLETSYILRISAVALHNWIIFTDFGKE
jgi:hypothetical protein